MLKEILKPSWTKIFLFFVILFLIYIVGNVTFDMPNYKWGFPYGVYQIDCGYAPGCELPNANCDCVGFRINRLYPNMMSYLIAYIISAGLVFGFKKLFFKK